MHARAMLRMRISSILSCKSAKKDSETVEPIRMPESTALNPQIYGVGAAERCRVALFPSLGGRVLLISREIVHWHRHKLAAVINGDPDAPTLKLSTRTVSQERQTRPAAQNPHPSSTAVSIANRTPRSVVAQLRTSLQHLDRQNRPSTAAVAVDRSRKEPAPAPPHSGSRPGSCATRNHPIDFKRTNRKCPRQRDAWQLLVCSRTFQCFNSGASCSGFPGRLVLLPIPPLAPFPQLHLSPSSLTPRSRKIEKDRLLTLYPFSESQILPCCTPTCPTIPPHAAMARHTTTAALPAKTPILPPLPHSPRRPPRNTFPSRFQNRACWSQPRRRSLAC